MYFIELIYNIKIADNLMTYKLLFISSISTIEIVLYQHETANE